MGFPTIDQERTKSCFLPKLLQNTPNDGRPFHQENKNLKIKKIKRESIVPSGASEAVTGLVHTMRTCAHHHKPRSNLY